MLGAAKMNEDFFIFFYSTSILIIKNVIQKSIVPQNNYFIALLSSMHDLPPAHSRTSTYSYLIEKDVQL